MDFFSLPTKSTIERADSSKRQRKWFFSIASTVIGLGALLLVLYLDRNNHMSQTVIDLGPWGVIVAILIMALVCLTPLPGEFLLLMDMRIYGVWWGIGVGWVGSIVGALAAFALSRSIGRVWMTRLVSPHQIQTVEAWVLKSRTVGLLAARLLPIPSSAVNYALGMLHTVSLWTYLWTGAVTAVPYYACTGLVYVGVFQRWTVWSVVILLAMGAFWILSLVGRKIWKERKRRDRTIE
jgi:uncharacterized membrane protein YdjX (TVP38/TMEM64 family)